MKKILMLCSMAACMSILMCNHQAMAQEDESSSVHITIKENGKVTTDTTFELKEGQDPDMVRKMVQHMVGEDDVRMKKNVFIMRKGDDDFDHKELAWVHVDSDDNWHVTSSGMGINLDSLKEAHGGGKVMVFKDEDGNITVRELGEDEHMEWTEDGDDDVEVMVIKKGDKDVKVVKKVTVEIEDESEEGEEKEIEVEVKTKKEKK